MKNRGNRAERIAALKKGLSRRDFGRRAIMLAAASNIAARSIPAFAVGVPMDHLKGENGIGDSCYKFLENLGPSYPMYDLLFCPFRGVVDQLRGRYATVGPVGSRLDTLRMHLMKIEERDAERSYSPTLAELYAYKDPPNTIPITKAEWHKISNICDYIKGYISIPFVGMHQTDRDQLKNLFIADTTFRDTFSSTRRFPYRELFTQGRDVMFPNWRTPNSVDELRYTLVRKAFRLGAFRHKTLEMEVEHYGLQGMSAEKIRFTASPNGKCWNGTTCADDICNLYCQEDSPNGPTSASDDCAECP